MFSRSQLKHLAGEYPIGNPFGGPAYGRKEDFILGNDAPAAPDYTPIATANEASAKYAKDAADNDLAFRKQVYSDSQPMQKGLYELTSKVADSQLSDAATSRDRSSTQWNQYQKTFVPVEEQMAKEAMEYGSEADQAQQAGRAVSDARAQAAASRASGARAMAAMGVNPNSGRFAGMSRANDINEAALAAGGANSARIAARDKGIGLRAGAAAFGRNQVNSAGQMTGLATASGNAAVGNTNTGFQSGLPYASFAAGGTHNAIQAANAGIQANLGMGQLMSNDYRAGLSQDSGLGGLGQLAGGLAAAKTAGLFPFSDRRLKEDVEWVGKDENTGINIYEFKYIGDESGKRYQGVMAQEVEPDYPDAVVYDDLGFASVNYGMLGMQMVEV